MIEFGFLGLLLLSLGRCQASEIWVQGFDGYSSVRVLLRTSDDALSFGVRCSCIRLNSNNRGPNSSSCLRACARKIVRKLLERADEGSE